MFRYTQSFMDEHCCSASCVNELSAITNEVSGSSLIKFPVTLGLIWTAVILRHLAFQIVI